ncbi:MAG: Maf family protein [Anaerolinea sp.]|nr:Maf family protein [Anaerolinea sp.]
MTEPFLLLASNSPRRRQLLRWMGLMVLFHAVDLDETPREGEVALQYVSRLAQAKARAASAYALPGWLVLGADTVVVDGEALLGKPTDEADARRMLRQLRGHTHRVCSAVALYDPQQDQLWQDVYCAEVPMRAYDDDEIEAYLKTGDPFDKAGAYAIQHPGFHPVETFADCYACVVGLPLCHLARLLKQAGRLPQLGVPLACRVMLGYRCSVFPQILGTQGLISGFE